MGKIKEYFTDRGLTAADLPKALIIHEVISVAFAGFMWTVRARPSPRAHYLAFADIVQCLENIVTISKTHGCRVQGYKGLGFNGL